jgi:hypothetical protein
MMLEVSHAIPALASEGKDTAGQKQREGSSEKETTLDIRLV